MVFGLQWEFVWVAFFVAFKRRIGMLQLPRRSISDRIRIDELHELFYGPVPSEYRDDCVHVVSCWTVPRFNGGAELYFLPVGSV